MKMNLSWGTAVLVTVWAASALAQVPKGAGGTGTVGGTPAPSAAPPVATAPSATPEPAPAPVEAAPASAAPPVAEAAPASPEVDEDTDEETPRRKKSKKRRHHIEDEQEEEEGDEVDEPPVKSGGSDWKLRGPHFILGAERLTSILSWSQTSTTTGTFTDPNTGNSFSSSVESEESGTDVSLLGAGGFIDNPFSIPRVGFDYMFGSGFTLGGSLGYMVTSGKSEDKDSEGMARTRDRPTVDIFLFAPRIGMFIAASPKLGIWLRGGITRLALSSESESSSFDGGTIKSTYTLTLVDATLDPQLVFTPVPRVGITVGPTLDIGLSGSVERTGNGSVSSSTDTEFNASSYGVTAGLVALF
jgi:hypothetical protein